LTPLGHSSQVVNFHTPMFAIPTPKPRVSGWQNSASDNVQKIHLALHRLEREREREREKEWEAVPCNQLTPHVCRPTDCKVTGECFLARGAAQFEILEQLLANLLQRTVPAARRITAELRVVCSTYVGCRRRAGLEAIRTEEPASYCTSLIRSAELQCTSYS